MREDIYDAYIAEVIKDDKESYECSSLVRLNKYKFYMYDRYIDIGFFKAHDDCIYIDEIFYEDGTCGIKFSISYKTAKKILNDIKISEEDFFKKHFALVLRENKEYNTFIYLNGKFRFESKKDNIESIVIQFSAGDTNHEFKEGVYNEKNKSFEKSSVTGIVLNSRHKGVDINEIITPDNFKKILNIND